MSGFAGDLGPGERAGLDRLMPAVYAELRKLARSYMHRERSDHTLQPTALVHEAYLRMAGQHSVDWHNRAQLLGIAARMMRRILLDHASAKNTAKRAGGAARITLTDDLCLGYPDGIELLDLDRALRSLAEIDSQQAAVVELRFFGGLNNQEVSEVLRMPARTVERRWASARLWLVRNLSGDKGV